MSGPQAEIMRTALNDFMGTEANWCRGTYARSVDGFPTSVAGKYAVSHCAEGAITAAAMVQMQTLLVKEVWRGVEQVLFEQNPKFVEAVREYRGADNPFLPGRGITLPTFNDGNRGVSGIGYEGIRAAFEKYLAECEEKGL